MRLLITWVYLRGSFCRENCGATVSSYQCKKPDYLSSLRYLSRGSVSLHRLEESVALKITQNIYMWPSPKPCSEYPPDGLFVYMLRFGGRLDALATELTSFLSLTLSLSCFYGRSLWHFFLNFLSFAYMTVFLAALSIYLFTHLFLFVLIYLGNGKGDDVWVGKEKIKERIGWELKECKFK